MDPQRQLPPVPQPPPGQQPPQPGQSQQDPLTSNPLFQSAYGAAQQAAATAAMQGQDPYQAALAAAHQGVRAAAQPDPSHPGGANLQKVQQYLIAKGEDPDRALALAHQILPRLGAAGAGNGG